MVGIADKGNRGFRRIVKAAAYSWKGFVAAWVNEEAFRQEIMVCLVLVPLALWFGDNGIERAMLVLTVLLVPLVELMNSAIEAVVDRVSPDQHPLSGRAKDMGSAAVFVSLVIMISVWILILL